MNLDIDSWEKFYLGDLFDIKKGKRLTSDDQEDGENLYIGAIDSNNGVANHIAQSPIHDGNTISLSYNGSVGEAFYQPEPYWATDDVNALYPKFEGFNEYIGLFFVAVIRQEKYRFSYGRKWTLENMKISEICLPIQRKNNKPIIDATHKYSPNGYVPDWSYMETYIKSLHHKPLTTNNKHNSTELNVEKWGKFKVSSILKIYNGKGITKEEIEENPGTFNAVQSGELDNGVIGKIDLDYCKEMNYTYTEKLCLTVARSGSAGFVSFQVDGCVVGDSAKILLLDDDVENVYVYLFLQTILTANRFKYAYGRKVTEEKYMNDTIKLPIVLNNDKSPYIDKMKRFSEQGYVPDWQYMEDYIKSLPYGDRV